MEPDGFSGGLVLFWKKSVSVDLNFADKNMLDCQIHFGSFSFFVSCIYGNPVSKYRHMVLERGHSNRNSKIRQLVYAW